MPEDTQPAQRRQRIVSGKKGLGFPFLGTNVGILSKRPRQLMFLPPSTKSPLFVYNTDPDQRSFLSLAHSEGSERSASTFRSLPSTINATDDEIESISAWLEEERERRSLLSDHQSREPSIVNYGSIHNVEEEIDDELEGYFDDNTNLLKRRVSSAISFEGIVRDEEEEDFMNEKVSTNSEVKKLVRYSIPLMMTFFLEQIFSIISVIFIGHLGKEELAAVSMASMTSTIVFAIFEGIATALDTLCPQAYGSGQLAHVGIHTQRCSLFSLVVFIPAALFWWFSGYFLELILDDELVIQLTQKYLRILILGGPPYILFENGKRFLLAQGIFDASTYILLCVAPLNIFLNWFLIYYLDFEFIGAPIASVISFWMLFICLVSYVLIFEGGECWDGFSSSALTQWCDLIELAVPGIIMLLAESLAYEVLTLVASYFGTTALATQSALSSLVSLIYMIPFALSVASSTRIANFIGGENVQGSKIGIKVGLSSSLVLGLINGSILFLFGSEIGKLFTEDAEVLAMFGRLSWLIGIFLIMDSVVCMENGIMRAMGLQMIGGVFSLVGYYLISVPMAVILSFKLGWGLEGLWIGNLTGLVSIGIFEMIYIHRVDWEKIIQAAKDRLEPA